MELRTASAVIGFAESLETGSAKFYEAAALRFAHLAASFHDFAKENGKNVQAIKRAYYSVISDALETGFSFQDLTTEPYLIETDISQSAGAAEILKIAIANETRIENFYRQAAKCSETLLADLPRVFKRLAGNREKRKTRLMEGLEKI
jgi:hypothetical protein